MRCLLYVRSVKRDEFTMKLMRALRKMKYEENKIASKRVNLVPVKLIKEGSILYEPRRVSSPKDAFDLGKEFLIDSEREKLILVCLDDKNKPTSINTVSIGS